MTIKTTVFSKISVLLLLFAAAVFIAGCDNQPPAAQETQDEHVQGVSGHSDHEDEGHNQHEQEAVQLTKAQLDEMGVKLGVAGPGALLEKLSLAGKVVLDPRRIAHIASPVSGVVQQVAVHVGDQVKTGDVLVVLNSRELAQTRSSYLAAQALLDLAKASFEREQRLYKQKIAPEAEFLQARQELREAKINLNLAKNQLRAIGLNPKELPAIASKPNQALTRYKLTAPISGTVISWHLTRGELFPVAQDNNPLVIADLSSVLVKLTVYPKDLEKIIAGQKVMVTSGNGQLKAAATIDYLSAVVNEKSHSATARVVLANPKGQWKPGMFVTGQVITKAWEGKVVVPATALQTIEGKTIVFKKTKQGFKPQPVEVGHVDDKQVEIISGLQTGDRYAAVNSFILKAEMLKDTFSGHHH